MDGASEPAKRRAHELYAELREDMRTRWGRDLPFEELLFDRWERARSLGFGEGASIYHNSYVYGDVQIGSKTWIGPFTLLDGTGGLTIGSGCHISAGVLIYSHDTVAWVLSGGKSEYDYAPVTIGDCCHIGSGAVINKGCTIGDHCVVGAQSFVNDDIPPYTVAFGVPCRPRGRVEVSGESVRLVMDPELS
jgi:acetyltransferase-like isoleucine patch superfamily enzyme